MSQILASSPWLNCILFSVHDYHFLRTARFHKKVVLWKHWTLSQEEKLQWNIHCDVSGPLSLKKRYCFWKSNACHSRYQYQSKSKKPCKHNISRTDVFNTFHIWFIQLMYHRLNTRSSVVKWSKPCKHYIQRRYILSQEEK